MSWGLELYTAGDVTDVPEKQIVVAASKGPRHRSRLIGISKG